MSPIDQARTHLTEPPAAGGLIGTFLAAGLCALSAVLLAGAMIFGQLT